MPGESGEPVEDEAFVSLVTNNSYANGALVLGYSLRRVNTTRKLVLLVAREVLEPTRERLARVWDHLEIVDLLDSEDTTNLALLTRPELGVTFTKIHCWNLTQYRKCVFLDADTLVVQNCDELFERDELSAVPDIGWPDCFNSGVFVFEPSRATYEAILEYAVEHGSFDGGDQGLLNSFFSDWRTADISRHLSFIYNMNSNASYTYAPAFQQFGRDVKIVHFIGPVKPWHHTYNPATGNVSSPCGGRGYVPHERSFLQLWWDIYVTFVQPEMRQCHDDWADDSAASDHFQPAPHFPPEHHFEPAPYLPPPQFHHEPYIPPPEPYSPPPPSPPPPQHYEPPPQHYEPPPHHYEPPPQHYEPPPQHYEPPPQHYEPPPQHCEPPPQHYEPPPQHHEPPPHYEPPPQHHEPPAQQPPPQHHEPPPEHYAPPPQHHEPVPPPPSPHIPQHGWPAEMGQAHTDHQEEYYHADSLANELADIHITEEVEELDPKVLDLRHRQAWESGEIDYRGRDKFECILGRIQECIGSVLRDPTDVPTFLF